MATGLSLPETQSTIILSEDTSRCETREKALEWRRVVLDDRKCAQDLLL